MPITTHTHTQPLSPMQTLESELSGVGRYARKAQSSPGYLQVGHVPSNWTRHIPQTSSSGMSHRQEATAFHSFIVTFMVCWPPIEGEVIDVWPVRWRMGWSRANRDKELPLLARFSLSLLSIAV